MTANSTTSPPQDMPVREDDVSPVRPTPPPRPFGPASPEVLRAYAHKPLLHRGEAVALLQGLTPPIPQFGNEKICYLDDYADVVQRFLQDCTARVIPVPCRPVELAAWALKLGVQLPEPFLDAINSPPD